jgi:hypothetical protein
MFAFGVTADLGVAAHSCGRCARACRRWTLRQPEERKRPTFALLKLARDFSVDLPK